MTQSKKEYPHLQIEFCLKKYKKLLFILLNGMIEFKVIFKSLITDQLDV